MEKANKACRSILGVVSTPWQILPVWWKANAERHQPQLYKGEGAQQCEVK